MGMRSRSREGRRGDRHEDAQRSDRGDASRWADRSRSREGRNYDSSWQRRSDGANDDQRGSATKRSRSHRGHDYNSWRDRNNLGRDEHRGPGPQGHGRSRSGHGSFADQRVANLVVPCVWLGGCHEDITEREIEKVCSMFGPVEGVTIKRSSRDTFAFVEYAEMSQARDAILELDQTAPFGSGVIKAAPANKKPSDNHRDNDRDQRDQHANSKDWNWGKQGYYSRDSHNGWHDRSWPNGGSRGYGRDTHDGQDTRDDRVGRDGRDTRDDRGGRDGRDGRNDRGDRVGRDARDDRGGRGGRDVCEERAGRHDRGGYERERERSLPRRDPSLERPPQKERRMRVMLSQLPRDTEEDELTEIAAEYGNVLEYELHREGAYKCGWVEYATKKEAEAAVGALNDRRMDEWHMRLQAYAYPGGGH